MVGFIITLLSIIHCAHILYQTEQIIYAYIPVIISIIALSLSHFTNPCEINILVTNAKNTPEQQLVLDKYTSKTKYGTMLKPAHGAFSSWSQRMILFYDHYCAWISNDVGLYNFRYFIQFTLWFGILCIEVVAIIATIMYDVYVNHSHVHTVFLHSNRYEYMISLFLYAMLANFTFTNGFLGFLSVKRGLTAVDIKKGLKREDRMKGSYDNIFSKNMIYNLLPLKNNQSLYEYGDNKINLCLNYFIMKGIKFVYK